METSEFIIMKPVENDGDAETLRNFRNECKDYMTRNTNFIYQEDQFTWWRNLYKENNKLFLVHKVVDGVVAYIIGYGYIRVENGEVLLTGGLTEKERGKGHGLQLFSFLLENGKKFNLPVRLELLKSNVKAFIVYNNLGFRVTSDDGKIIKMEYRHDSAI